MAVTGAAEGDVGKTLLAGRMRVMGSRYRSAVDVAAVAVVEAVAVVVVVVVIAVVDEIVEGKEELEGQEEEHDEDPIQAV